MNASDSRGPERLARAWGQIDGNSEAIGVRHRLRIGLAIKIALLLILLAGVEARAADDGAGPSTNGAGAEDVVDAIFKSMDEFTHERQTDDATVVVLRVH